MSYPVRARPAPADLADAVEIAAPLVGDIRLRAEEHEAIEMLVAEARKQREQRVSNPNSPWRKQRHAVPRAR